MSAPVSGPVIPWRTLVASLVLVAVGPLRSTAAENAPPPASGPDALRVGTLPAPPFVIRGKDGQWTGVAIELWEEVARRQGLSYRYHEYDLAELLEAVESRRIDVAVGPLLMTADRERRMDLTIPFMHVALAIGARPAGDWWTGLRSSLSAQLLWSALGIAGLLTLFAVLVWLLERRRNPEHFGGGAMRGIGDAIWWSASTMTTVGYGDRTPVTFWGRTVGIVWMIAAIFLVSSLIAAVTSSLTVHRLESRIRSLTDLTDRRIGVVASSGSEQLVRARGILPMTFDTDEAAVDALTAGTVDAVVEEWPVLRYLAAGRYAGRMVVIPQPEARGFVAFALPLDSPRRRALNVTILEVLDDPDWQRISQTFLGE